MSLILSHINYLRIKWVIWISFILYCFFILPKIETYEVQVGICLSGILIQLTLIPFIRNWNKFKRPKLLDWFRLVTFLTLVLDFLFIAENLDSLDNIIVNKVVFVNSSTCLISLFAVLLGVLSLNLSEVIIYILLKKNHFKNSQIKIRSYTVLYFITILALLIQIFLIINGIVGYGTFSEHTTSSYSFLLQIVDILGPFILSLLAILYFIYTDNKKRINIIFWTFFILQIVIGFLSGMKEEVLTPIVLVLIPYLLSGHLLPKWTLVVSFIFIVIMYPVNNTYRDILNSNVRVEKSDALKIAIVKTFSDDLLSTFEDGSKSYSSRLSLFPMLMYSVYKEHSWNHYKNMNRYLILPIAWIVPRFILPSKPTSETGSKLYEMTTGFTTNSITPSTYGWSYFEGGLIFVIFSFLIFGLVINYIELKINLNSPYNLILYSSILIILLKAESDIYFVLSRIFQTILVYQILFHFFIKQINYEKK